MARLALAVVVAVLFGATSASAGAQTCVGLTEPVRGPIVGGFAPVGQFSGHWGVDWAVSAGTEVGAAGAGTVTFAGRVAGNLTVTVAHGGGLRTSYSYLSALTVRRGEQVGRGTVLGRSGVDHSREALHFSARLGSTYIDPVPLLRCLRVGPSRSLRLVEGGEAP